MKSRIGIRLGVNLVAMAAVAGLASCSRASAPARGTVPQLALEMTGSELQQILAQHPDATQTPDAGLLKPVLDLGKRNLDWIIYINQHRPADAKLSFTSKENEEAYPIDQPRVYNPQIVLQEFSDLKKEIPSAMSGVLFQNGALTDSPPIAEADYLRIGHAIDKVYQIGLRWLLLAPNAVAYEEYRHRDIRGFYSLSHEPDLDAHLKAFGSLDAATQAKYRGWLAGMCFNGESANLKACAAQVDQLISSHGDLLAYYQSLLKTSQDIWNQFFTMGWSRHDISWPATDPAVMTVPFVRPESVDVATYLTDNIDDEWRQPGWNLKLDLREQTPTDSYPSIIQQPGTLPHVDETLNHIVMDANAPLTEYDVRWTIRHEFGHILGFVDCYVEFYDIDAKTMTSYQLDITNLMCSRRGHFQSTHYNELKRVYFGH